LRRPWAAVRNVAAALAQRCHFIFHISHVGSTLLSRLLGHHPALFSLREPAILRKCAEIHGALGTSNCPWSRAEFDSRMAVFLALWSRTFHREQTAVIKATSFVSEMAEYLLEHVADARAICMFVSPETFLKSLLGGAMSDITSKVEQRLERLHRRLDGPRWRAGELSAGECVAMSWLCEMLALHSGASRFPERILWVNFDRFLQSPQTILPTCFRHLGVSEDFTVSILAGPTMSQYAKAPTQNFNATIRNQLLQRDAVRHASEIQRGMDFLNRAVNTCPEVGSALEAIERASRQTKS
jgi:hypothetical protein